MGDLFRKNLKMRPPLLNYKHLYYFWIVSKEGNISRAARRLDLAPQTVSVQLSQLEQSLGAMLFSIEGRRLALSEAGKLVLRYADEIFDLGAEMQEVVLARKPGRALPLKVGIVGVLPKLLSFRLLEPALRLPERVRIVCHDGGFEPLLAQLALRKLDVVLADRPVGDHENLRVFSHALGESGLTFFGSAKLAKRYRDGFPASLEGAPMLLPTRDNLIRTRLDQWFEAKRIGPEVVCEIQDSALLKTFGRAGVGIFAAPSKTARDVAEQYRVVAIGKADDVREQFFAISAERRIKHPAVVAICEAARQRLFKESGR